MLIVERNLGESVVLLDKSGNTIAEVYVTSVARFANSEKVRLGIEAKPEEVDILRKELLTKGREKNGKRRNQ